MTSNPATPAPGRAPASASTGSPQSKPLAHAHFRRSVSIVGLAFVASRVLGLFREIVLANRFGTSADYDAYISAFRIPDLLFLVVMSGAFGSAFIPVFSGFLIHGQRESANRLASAVITWTALITVVLGVLVFVFASPLMRYVVAPDLSPDAMDLAIRTMRLLLVSPLLLGLAIAAKGILEAQSQFVFSAIAPVLYNLSILIAALVFAPNHGIDAVTAGVIAGAVLQVMVQAPAVIRSGLVYRPMVDTNTAGLREVGRLLVPRVIGQAAFQINFVAVNAFAASAGEGRVSGLNYAWQLMMLPNGVLALSISTVLFPSMVRHFELGEMDQLKAALIRATRQLLFLLVPASMGLFLFGRAIVQTIFQSGSFDSTSTRLAADPLALLAAGLIFYGLVELLARTFYSMKDSITPVVAGIVIIALNIILSWAVVERLEHVGLAMSLSISTMVEAGILLVVLRRRIGRFGSRFGSWLVRVIAATAVMAAVAESIRPRLEEETLPGAATRLEQLAMLLLATMLAATAYFASTWFLRLPESLRMATALDARFRTLFRRKR